MWTDRLNKELVVGSYVLYTVNTYLRLGLISHYNKESNKMVVVYAKYLGASNNQHKFRLAKTYLHASKARQILFVTEKELSILTSDFDRGQIELLQPVRETILLKETNNN